MRPRLVLLSIIASTLCPLTSLPTAAAAAASPFVASRELASPHVFRSTALPLAESRYRERWRRAISRPAPSSLMRLVEPARSMDRQQQLDFVNASLNRHIRYRPDRGPEGDNWATPEETLSRLAGDCEDIAIAKLLALKLLGFADDQLFLTIGQDRSAGTAHALLLVRDDDGFQVLDNRSDRTIPEERVRSFDPLLSFSGSHSWAHGVRAG